MQEKNERKSKSVALRIVAGVVFTATAIVVTPIVVKKLTNAYCRSNAHVDDIDIDNMGPIIVNKQGVPVEVEDDAD